MIEDVFGFDFVKLEFNWVKIKIKKHKDHIWQRRTKTYPRLDFETRNLSSIPNVSIFLLSGHCCFGDSCFGNKFNILHFSILELERWKTKSSKKTLRREKPVKWNFEFVFLREYNRGFFSVFVWKHIRVCLLLSFI